MSPKCPGVGVGSARINLRRTDELGPDVTGVAGVNDFGRALVDDPRAHGRPAPQPREVLPARQAR